MKQSNKNQISGQQLYDYMIFFDDEWQMPPSFYWIAQVKGKTPEDAIATNLAEIIRDARASCPNIFAELDDEFIEERLCTVRRDFWTSCYTRNLEAMFSNDA
jgi:hypothetical protein